MFTIKALKITLDIPRDHEMHNHDLIGYVIQKYPRKVIKVSVLTRESVETWYDEASLKYPKSKFVFLVGTVSLVGTIFGKYKENEFESTERSSADPHSN